MYVTKHTDYSFRTLMLLAMQKPDMLMSIAEISKSLNISKTHLMKVVNRLATLELVETVRGRHGGVRLWCNLEDVNIGTVFRELEEIEVIINCGDGPCLFLGICRLDKMFHDAAESFVRELDRYTLADLVHNKLQLQTVIRRHVKSLS